MVAGGLRCRYRPPLFVVGVKREVARTEPGGTMPHYLLAVHSVEGESREPMSDEQMQAFMGRINELEEENQSTLRGPRRS
jgi:hypothetical protein